MVHKRKIALAVLGVLLVLLIASLLYPRTQKVSEPLIPVSIGNGTHVLSGLLAIADQEGFFTDEGLVVTITPYGSGAQAFDEMRQGKHDMATAAETPFMLNRFTEDTNKILATIGTTDNESKIIARRDAGIATPQDLNGKRIAIHKKGSSPHFFLYLYLLSNGIAMDDIELTIIPVEKTLEALLDGSIDAISFSEPLATETAIKIGEKGIIFAEPGLYNRAYNIHSTDSFIAKNPKAVEKVLSALMKATAFAKANPTQAKKDVAQGFSIDEAVVEEAWKHQELQVTLTQSLLSMLDEEARWAKQSKLVDSTWAVPNYLEALYLDGLTAVHPAGVNVIR